MFLTLSSVIGFNDFKLSSIDNNLVFAWIVEVSSCLMRLNKDIFYMVMQSEIRF